MCIAILQKPGAKTLEEQVIRNCFNNNDDGSGIAYVDESNKIQVRKYREVDSFVDQYQQLHKKYGDQTPFMIHSRIGTHGTSDGTTNVHPFWVNSDMVFCHNGVINKVRDDKKLSDTQVFNKDYLQNLPNLWIDNNVILNLISDYIGSSKLIFLTSDRKFKIVNKKLGHWVEKTWFSNSSYKRNVFDFGGQTSYGSCGIGNNNSSNTAWNRSQGVLGFYGTQSKKDDGYRLRYQHHDPEPCMGCDEVSLKQHTSDKVDGIWLCSTCYKTFS